VEVSNFFSLTDTIVPLFTLACIVSALLLFGGLFYAVYSGDWIGTTFSFIIHLTGIGGLFMFIGSTSEKNPRRAWVKLLMSGMVVFMCWLCMDLLVSAWH